ncbi:MAG TPA: aminoglycoside phosphotransferase family protein [Thermomicrobiales bacterium]|nr:aminoglycoside phosphotransferase family protein [Thermomicrobiales bacterium]
MSTRKMHDNEVEISIPMVRRLLAGQFPEWAGLPLEPVPSAGTDNALFRLGADMAVRMPRIDWAIAQAEKEVRWLPQLAPHLPLPIPLPLAQGRPGEGYPWSWSVTQWLPGETATRDRLADPLQAARDLAAFVRALHSIDPTGGPEPGEINVGRGVPLAKRDASTREALAALRGKLDTDAAAEAWQMSLDAPVWQGPPVWIHGDLQSGNLLTVDGRLSAVIDFGCLGIGDPAVDMIIAWNFFDRAMREAYRAALDIDDATWLRGRGWALSTSLIALPYYEHTNPYLTGISRYAIAEILAEVERGE